MKVWLISICAVTAVFCSATANAQVTVDITKITCRQFLTGRVVPTNSMALWFSGYYAGKAGATTIDASTVRPNAEKVKDYCGLHQDDTVMNAVQVLFGK
jgi:acid stress chaperone HdeB